MEWAIELALEYNIPVAASMCIGPLGDRVGIPAKECAERMVAPDIVGINCLFDPQMSLETMQHFKSAVSGLRPGIKKPHLMVQANGCNTQDTGRTGWCNVDEMPYGKGHITIISQKMKSYMKLDLLNTQ